MKGRAGRLEAFRERALERLSWLMVSWIRIEQGVALPDAVDRVLRELHALKGETAVLGFGSATDLIHALETAVQAKAFVGDAVLRALDVLAELVNEDPAAPKSPAVATLISELEKPAPAPTQTQTQTQTLTPIPTPTSSTPAAQASRPDPGVRVTPMQLDRMRDIVGDLMLLRSRLSRFTDSLGALHNASRDAVGGDLKRFAKQLRDDGDQLGNLVGALEEITSDLRLVSIQTLLERYPRIARDLGRELGKDVRLVFESELAGVDRGVADSLDEALLHLVRNAVDHGIEPAAERREHGKPAFGTIRIDARTTGARLEITITDDGAGVDIKAVRARAIRMGLVEPGAADATDDVALQWILLPGLTTRTVATQISGRGVGLDAVHVAVQTLGGSLVVTSEADRGTSFRITVPISTAVSPVVLFRVGNDRYALPASSIENIVDVAAYPVSNGISGSVISYNRNDVPLIALDQVLQALPQQPPTVTAGLAPVRTERAPRLIVATSALGIVALEGSYDHEQRVAIMRPAGTLFSPRAMATAAIALENGDVAVVLNPSSILRASRRRRRDVVVHNQPAVGTIDRPPVESTVAGNTFDRPPVAAMPVATAVPGAPTPITTVVERSGANPGASGLASGLASGPVVTAASPVAHAPVTAPRPDPIATASRGSVEGAADTRPVAATRTPPVVLVAEDSPIVRDIVAESLRSHGVHVIEAVDGQDALEQLDVHADISLLVTDVDMPRLDGLELLRRLRARAGRRIPAVVVSSRGTEADRARAIEIGADAYLVKAALTGDSLWTLVKQFVGLP